MSTESKKKQFEDIIMGMLDTYIRKNHDYGNSFEETLDDYGLLPAIIRMKEKLKRAETIIHGDNKVNDESLIDSLLDLANYAIMTTMYINSRVTEECPYCEEEVTLNINFNWQICPKCGNPIKPCSLCDSNTTSCSKCSLDQDKVNHDDIMK